VSWLDTLLVRGNEAKRQASPSSLPVRKGSPGPAKPRPKPEIKSVFATVHLPRDGDPGQITTGHYFVSDGTVTICDAAGKPTGKTYRLGAGENERQIASRLTLEAYKTATPDFDRRLDYPRHGYA